MSNLLLSCKKLNQWRRAKTNETQSQVPVEEIPNALGRREGTGSNAIEGDLIEVDSPGELKTLGEKSIKGRIIFF